MRIQNFFHAMCPAHCGIGSLAHKSVWKFAAILAVTCTLTASVTAGAVRSGFDGVALDANDDGSSPAAVPIGFEVNFFGVTHTDLWVNNNGNVTFGEALDQFTPSPIVATQLQIIAAFWADVDTRSAASGLTRYSSGGETISGHRAFGVTWNNVGYYSQEFDKLNSFQIILIERQDTGAGDFDIEFNYDKIQWETGDHSTSGGQDGLGGKSARAGYANGGEHAQTFELPGSGVNGAFLDTASTGLIHGKQNSTIRGRYVFHVHNGVVAQPSGTFASLLADAAGHTGMATIRLNENGSFSINVSLTGIGNFSGRGMLDQNQDLTVNLGDTTVAGKIVNGTIRIVVTNGSNSFDGTLVQLHRGATPAGNYTMLLPIEASFANDPSVPHGTGYALLFIDSSGKVRVTGSTGDGTKFGMGSGIRVDGTCPIFASPYPAHTGELQGSLTFASMAGSDFDGVLTWVKPATPGDTFYPGGFTASINAIGSRYAKPKKQTGMLQLGATPTLTAAFTEGNLAAQRSALATIPEMGEPTVVRPLRSLTLVTRTGLFNGYVVHDDGVSRFYLGVIFQLLNRGEGYFLGTDKAGKVTIAP